MNPKNQPAVKRGNGGPKTGDAVDHFILCLCGNLLCRQDRKNPNVIRFKEKEFYLELIGPGPQSIVTNCRRCSRRNVIAGPGNRSLPAPDIIDDANKLKEEMDDARKT
ncbi:MAG: hypothetical protein GY847_01420 [Proteobacteria bacterium]|nr:hypothetical protein [Pseudomonadota bacterium]